ncbi:MAG: helix-turn-helix transcriptional regulator [Candidatus Eremiobacteraeota bacterium]|nr:helix-turn-helix transcriptional regulator [Candidatus Eremiobacteraeota bacterium]
MTGEPEERGDARHFESPLLLIGPKRFSDIQRRLPGIPTNILTARLNELEDSGLDCARRALRSG